MYILDNRNVFQINDERFICKWGLFFYNVHEISEIIK